MPPRGGARTELLTLREIIVILLCVAVVAPMGMYTVMVRNNRALDVGDSVVVEHPGAAKGVGAGAAPEVKGKCGNGKRVPPGVGSAPECPPSEADARAEEERRRKEEKIRGLEDMLEALKGDNEELKARLDELTSVRGAGGAAGGGRGGGQAPYTYAREVLRLDQVGVEMVTALPAPGAADEVRWGNESPRITLLENFLSEEECDHLVELAKTRMHPSLVIGNGFKNERAAVRTSSGAFLNDIVDPVLQRVETRLAFYAQIPREMAEGIQVLKYEVGQEYVPHHDFLAKNSPAVTLWGQRQATTLMYLSDVEEGGETIFPSLLGNGTCGGKERNSICIKPKKGTALFWWDVMLDGGGNDGRTLHGGCPVVQGTKWVATRWYRTRCYGYVECPDARARLDKERAEEARRAEEMRRAAGPQQARKGTLKTVVVGNAVGEIGS